MQNQVAKTGPAAVSPQLNPSSPRWITKASYSDGGQYDGERIIGFDAAGLSVVERSALHDEVTERLAPMPARQLVEKLAILHATMKSRASDQVDLEVMFLAYAEDLSDVPGYAVLEAMRELRRTETFFPASSEIRKLAEQKAAPLKLAILALENRSPRIPHGPNVFRQVTQPRAAPDFVAQKMDEFNRRMGELDAEAKSSRTTTTLKALPVPGGPGSMAAAQELTENTEAA